MRKKLIAIVLLAFVLPLTGCQQLLKKGLQDHLTYLESFRFHNVSNYEGKVLILYIEDDEDDLWFKGYDFNVNGCFQLDRINMEYHYSQARFEVGGYDKDGGLLVREPGLTFGEWETISEKEFNKRAKPLIEFIMKNPQPILDAMRQAAVELGLIGEQI